MPPRAMNRTMLKREARSSPTANVGLLNLGPPGRLETTSGDDDVLREGDVPDAVAAGGRPAGARPESYGGRLLESGAMVPGCRAEEQGLCHGGERLRRYLGNPDRQTRRYLDAFESF